MADDWEEYEAEETNRINSLCVMAHDMGVVIHTGTKQSQNEAEHEARNAAFQKSIYARLELSALMEKDWDHTKHPRHEAGSSRGGEFAPRVVSDLDARKSKEIEQITDNVKSNKVSSPAEVSRSTVDESTVPSKNATEAEQATQHLLDTTPPVPPPPRRNSAKQSHVNSIDDLMNQAVDSEPEFDSLLKSMADNFRGQKVTPQSASEFEAILNAPGFHVIKGPMKKAEKIVGDPSKGLMGKVEAYKTLADGTPPIAQIVDVLRATVAVDKISEFPQAVEFIKQSGVRLAREPKVRMSKMTGAGYRDIMMNVELKSGHVVELQVNTKSMLMTKDKAHSLYNQQVAIEMRALSENRTPTRSENIVIKILENKMKDMYAAAWEKSGG